MRKLVMGMAMVIALTLCSFGVEEARAQGRVGVVTGHVGVGRVGVGHVSSARAHHARRFFAGGFAPYFYSDDEVGPEVVEAPERVSAPGAVVTLVAAKPADSVLLELQGDHWVRITNYGQAEVGTLEPGGVGTAAKTRAAIAGAGVNALPPAVLVFRDGHSEEIARYTIVGKTIYTGADYWASGSWTKKIATGELDVAATLKLNRERGTKFSLPSGPNEVVTRP